MQLFHSMDARMVSFDFKNRGMFRDTYSVLWGLKMLGFDPGRLSERPGIN